MKKLFIVVVCYSPLLLFHAKKCIPPEKLQLDKFRFGRTKFQEL